MATAGRDKENVERDERRHTASDMLHEGQCSDAYLVHAKYFQPLRKFVIVIAT